MTRQAELRVLRVISLLLGLAGVVFGLLVQPHVTAQIGLAPAWWSASALAATIGLPALLGVVAPFGSLRTLRVLAGAVGIGNLLAMATEPLVMAGGTNAADSPWLLQLCALGTTGAALAFTAPVVIANVLITGALVVMDRTLTTTLPLGLIPLQDGAYAAFFGGVFAALALGTLASARAVDTATATAIRSVRTARDERVHADERGRVDGLVHDHVLSTLLVAARSPDASAAADARNALTELRLLTEPARDAAPVPCDELLARLRAATASTARDAAFVTEGGGTAPVPATVADALTGAVVEALRNCRRHAGPDADIEVHVDVTGPGIEVVVLDDGIGFTRSDVPANRLGIVASIETRMRAVNGTADVRSRRGRGTVVQLCWSPA